MGPMYNTPLARIIWYRFTVPRHAFCLWRLTLKWLPTNDSPSQLGVSLRRKDYELCFCNEETHQHILFECSYSQCVLQNVLSKLGFRLGLYRMGNVLMVPAYCQLQQVHKQALYACLTTIGYCIWIERNSRLHQKRQNPPNLITNQCINLIKERLRFLRKVGKKKRVQDILMKLAPKVLVLYS